ncbi:hypothetical protein CHH53_04120 [Terribacillus sp. 7520-G]|nr:hypothetical protein CHH53_04120 [Terribacillus sp. 7520-G]
MREPSRLSYLDSTLLINDYKYGFEEGLDFYSVLSKSDGGRPSTEYFLKMDTAKEIAMVENNDQGRQIRKYFIEWLFVIIHPKTSKLLVTTN